jgi:hypothetical protein
MRLSTANRFRSAQAAWRTRLDAVNALFGGLLGIAILAVVAALVLLTGHGEIASIGPLAFAPLMFGALLTHTGYGSQDITSGTQVFDFSPFIYANLRQEEAVLAHLDIGDAVYDTAFYWVEDALSGNQVTTTATLATGATTLTVSAADLIKIGFNATSPRTGAVLQVISGPGGGAAGTLVDNGEQIQVTAFPSSTTATITRAYGLAPDPGLTYPTGAVWKMINTTLPENSDLQLDLSQKRTLVYNVTEIFERSINISRNQIKRLMQGIEDEFFYQVDQRAIELKRELNDTAIFGTQFPVFGGTFPQTNVGDNRTTGGILWYSQKAGSGGAGKTFNNVAEALTPQVLNTLHYASWKKGGNPTLLLTGGRQARVVQGFSTDLIRIVPNERVRQGFSTLFRTDLGVMLTLVVDGNFGDGAEGTVVLLDQSRSRLRPFIDAEMFMLVAPTFRDGDAARILCEWGWEQRNAFNSLDGHSVHTNLTIPTL